MASRAARRDRLRWLAAGVAVAVAAIAVAATLQAIVGWPAGLGPVAVGSLLAPLIALAVSGSGRLVGFGGRALVQTLSATAFAVMISLVYLIVVRGLGNAPTANADREALGLSMVAAALAAVSFGPARRRLMISANRLVFGTRNPPDDLIRAFASRLTRTTPMEELLLQLTESLVRTMDLVRADVYTGSGDVLERAAGSPAEHPRRSVTVTERERPAVVRAGVSGNPWIKVWLPELAPDDDERQLRVAPIRNAGELLGCWSSSAPHRASRSRRMTTVC